MCGVQCVMITGPPIMQEWSVDNWDMGLQVKLHNLPLHCMQSLQCPHDNYIFKQVHKHILVPTLVRAQDPFSLIMLAAVEQRVPFYNVVTSPSLTIVYMLKMLV